MLAYFEPAQYSDQDLLFLLDHIGQSPAVAFRSPLAPGTHQNRLDEVLRTVYEHEEIRKAEDGYGWAGTDALVDSISRYLKWRDLSREIFRRGARDANSGALITHPSMYFWDEDGRAFKFAADADSAECVRTEITEDGGRKPFGVTLANRAGETLPHIKDIAPWIKSSPGERTVHDDKVVDEKTGKNVSACRCTICGYAQQYDPRNPSARRMAMVRMYRHMKTAKENQTRHRLLLTKIAR